METIKINFCDFWKDFDKENNFFINILRQQYNVVIDKNPDFLIYSVFGMEYLNYDCVRIFYTAENYSPDFNLCDYAMGFDWISFDDRYLRLPYYYVRNKSEVYRKCKEKTNYNVEDIQNRKFCNFIYSNGGAVKLRKEFFEKLSEYKFVHSGGKFLNNIGGRVENKLAFQKDFKFSIAFENSSTNGYTTEKIIEAKVAGTVPIYWGNPLINKEMNVAAFINCHDYNNFNEVIEVIKGLDNNENKFLEMLNEPLFKDTTYELNDTIILDFFSNLFSHSEKQRKGHFQKNLERKYKQYSYFEKLKKIINKSST